MFVNDLDLFYAFKLYKNLLLCNQGSCPVFINMGSLYQKNVHGYRWSAAMVRNPHIYLPDSLLDWRERDVHSYDCDWIMKFGEHELNLKPHAQMLLITNEQECSHTLYTCRTLHACLLTYSHKKNEQTKFTKCIISDQETIFLHFLNCDSTLNLKVIFP